MGIPSLRFKPERYSLRFEHRSDWCAKTYRGLRTSPGDQVSPSEAGPICARIPEFSPQHAQRVGANHDRGSQGIALVAALPLMLVRGVDNTPVTPHPDEAPAASRSGRGRRVS
jgi:hypothetical protein